MSAKIEREFSVVRRTRLHTDLSISNGSNGTHSMATARPMHPTARDGEVGEDRWVSGLLP